MYCPSCGAADQKPDAYCRQCGLWLADPTSSRRHKSHTPSERMKVMAVFSGVNALFALISAIALYATYGGRPEAKWSVYVAANLCMVIAVHQTINFFFALGFRRKFKRDPARGDHAFGNKEQEAPLSFPDAQTGELIATPSVTENTTELLEATPRREAKRPGTLDARGR